MSYRNSDADGVPLYLNKKFYPVPRTKYKEVDCHIPLDALQEGYDFTVERQVLTEYEKYQEEKKEKEKAREELRQRNEEKAKVEAEAAAQKAAALVREYEEEMARQTKGNRENLPTQMVQEAVEVSGESYRTSRTSTSTNYPEVGNSNPSAVIQQPESSSCNPEPVNYPQQVISPETLKPPPASVSFSQVGQQDTLKPSESASYPQIIQPEPSPSYDPRKYKGTAKTPPINLSDFESDTANPFDNVELKSINDMAVLATVLQNNVTCNVPRNNFNQSGEQRVMSNTNVNVNSVNGAIPQPVSYYPSYLSQNSNSYNQWTPTSLNPFYSQFTPTMVTAAGTTVGTSVSSDSVPQHHQPTTSSLPMHRHPTSQENSTQYPTTAVITQNNQMHPPATHPSAENFANFYFPFTSSQAQSRLKNPDREFS